MKHEFDVENQQIIVREFTNAESKADQENIEINAQKELEEKIAEEAKIAAKADLFKKLGITAEDAKLLIP